MKEEISTEDFQHIVNIIRQQYGYDFTGYSQASLKRRIVRFMGHMNLSTIFDLKYLILNDKAFFEGMVQFITVNVTEMFRDPHFYKALRELVLPKLASYPIIKIWHAGCSSGEEVFSMAILLHEAGLLERSMIYATDLNPANLEKAKEGIIPLKVMKEYTYNYIQSGGTSDFSNYYTARYNNVIIHKELRKNIIYFQHNLVTDQVFNEFHLVCCRNVFIYFNRELQNRVLQLFYESLSSLGYLALGIKESLLFTETGKRFEAVSASNKIFRRKL